MSDFVYHVTYARHLPAIAEEGLQPGGAGSMGKGGVAGHARGRIFLTELDGVFFWHSRARDHAHHDSDDLFGDGMTPVVLRVATDDDLNSRLVEDPHGTRDAMADAYYLDPEPPEGAGLDPEEYPLEAWDGEAWVDVEEVADPGLWEHAYEQVIESDDDGEGYLELQEDATLPPEARPR